MAKDKDKVKETKSSSKAEDTTKAKEAANKVKGVKAKTRKIDPKPKDTSASQPSQKEDPPPPKAQT